MDGWEVSVSSAGWSGEPPAVGLFWCVLVPCIHNGRPPVCNHLEIIADESVQPPLTRFPPASFFLFCFPLCLYHAWCMFPLRCGMMGRPSAGAGDILHVSLSAGLQRTAVAQQYTWTNTKCRSRLLVWACGHICAVLALD